MKDEQRWFDLDDPRLTDLQKMDRCLLGKIHRLLRRYPDVVRRVAVAVRREMRMLEKTTCDVVAFVVRCRLRLDVDNDTLPWLTAEICALDSEIDRVLKPRRSRIRRIKRLIQQ